MGKSDSDFSKHVDLEPGEWLERGRHALPPSPQQKPEEGGLSVTGWITLIVTLGGISIANHGWPSLGRGDDICLVLFLAFCWWNYSPRRR